MNELLSAYLAGRTELYDRCARRLAAENLPHSALHHVFWGDFYADDAHLPVGIGGAELPRGGFTAPDLASSVTHDIEKVGAWKRLCVTTTWYLELDPFADAEAWFSSLSAKNRKKLRWLRNALPKLGATVSELATEADYDDFEKLYCAQFPKYRPGSPDMRGLRAIYRELAAAGSAFCRILRDRDGNALASSLAYTAGEALYYTHLTRTRGEYDKYSPGYYLTYAVIAEVLESRRELKHFFMGPGEYDYKAALGGTAFPVFRYERAGWGNLFGLIRLRHRAAKERKKSGGEVIPAAVSSKDRRAPYLIRRLIRCK